MKTPLRQETLEAYGWLLHQLAKCDYVVGIYPLNDADWAALDFTPEALQGWRGRIIAMVRLRDIKVAHTSVSRILPILDDRQELLDLLVLTLLRARGGRGWFEWFVTRLDPAIYGTVASASPVPPCTLHLFAPDRSDWLWRIGFGLNAADVSAMLNEAAQDLVREAAEGGA